MHLPGIGEGELAVFQVDHNQATQSPLEKQQMEQAADLPVKLAHGPATAKPFLFVECTCLRFVD